MYPGASVVGYWGPVRDQNDKVLYSTKDGALEASNAYYPSKIGDASIPGQMVMPRHAYTTMADAEAALKAFVGCD